MRKLVFGLLGVAVLVGMAGLKRYVIHEVDTQELADDIALTLLEFSGDDSPPQSSADLAGLPPPTALPSGKPTLTVTLPRPPSADEMMQAFNNEIARQSPGQPAAALDGPSRSPTVTIIPQADAQTGPASAAQVTVIRPRN